MGRFSTGFCIGLGLSLLFTPKTGEEMRQLVAERVGRLRHISLKAQGPIPLIEPGRVRLQEISGRIEPVISTDANAPTANPFQPATNNVAAARHELQPATQPAETPTATIEPAQETSSSSEEVPQDSNWPVRPVEVMPPTTEGVPETPENTAEVEQDLNQTTQPAASTAPAPTPDSTKEADVSRQDVQTRSPHQESKPANTTSPASPQKPASNTAEHKKNANRTTRQSDTGTPHHHKRPRR